MKDVALITVLFDYPENYPPSYQKNASKYFAPEDMHVVRHNGLIEGSYYDKLLFYKVNKLLDYVKEHILGKYKYMLFLDATDTNFYRDPSTIVEDFLELNKSLILGAERGMWPPTNYSHLYEQKRKDSDAYFLNSGTYFGYVDKIVEHLTNIATKNYQHGIDDQGQWTIEYLLHEDIEVDQERTFFFSTYNTAVFVDIQENGSVKLLNINPYVIHDNGPFTDDTIKLTDKLNEDNKDK